MRDFMVSRGILRHATIRDGFLCRHAVLSLERFRRFGEGAGEDLEMRSFVAVQDWLSEGYDLSERLSDEVRGMCGHVFGFGDLYGAVRGEGVVRERLACPCTLVLARDDEVTPPSQSLGVLERMGDVQVVTLPTGHLGMVMGRYREETVNLVRSTDARSRC
jgi:poly(3-hydroxyalkanoate) synthetase